MKRHSGDKTKFLGSKEIKNNKSRRWLMKMKVNTGNISYIKIDFLYKD